ncbi:hypothetical protein [Tenacibaculum sp. MEBiC06402]|uniref:hypothetical protein n=1 Tax=Tenacibaculum sp. MEBiC06402 TaxID=3412023 RepID=UPI003BABD7D3
MNLILLLFTSVTFCQVKPDFKVYQFLGNDSIKGHISRIVKHNSNGKISFEELINYKTSRNNGFIDVRKINFYKDTILIKTLKSYPKSKSTEKDSSRTEYKYNTKNQLIQETHFDYKRRLKKNIRKGIQYGDCIIEPSDYEEVPTWKITSQIKFTYNNKSKKTEYYASEHHWNNQNRYKYVYDEKNRIIKETSLDHNRVIWHKYYSYVENGYNYFLDWYGEFKVNTISDWPYKYKIRFKTDSNGNKIEETKLNKDGSQNYRVVRTIDSFNRIETEKRYDSKDEIELTKIYIYE